MILKLEQKELIRGKIKYDEPATIILSIRTTKLPLLFVYNFYVCDLT